MIISILAERDALDVQPAQLCIDGAWRDGQLPPFEHHHPATNELVTTVATASAADVDAAVRAARRAFDDSGWPSLAARDRRALLRRFVELVTTERDDLSRLQSLDNGAPLQHGLRNYQASGGVPAEVFEYYLGWIDKLHGETLPSYQTADLLTMTWREPIGVVAAIVPYNSPSFLWAQKVAPALCAGCTVVCKPSELAPLGVTRLVALLHEAGLPPGVVNLVHGPAEPTAARWSSIPVST